MNTRQKHLLEKELSGVLTDLERDELAAYKTVFLYTGNLGAGIHVEISCVQEGLSLPPHGMFSICDENGIDIIFQRSGNVDIVDIIESDDNQVIDAYSISMADAERFFQDGI